MRVLNFSYRQSTDVLLSHLWVVYQITVEQKNKTPVALVNSENEAKTIARKSFIKAVTKNIEAIIGAGAHTQIHWFANDAFAHKYSINEAVRNYFKAHMFDIRTLTPLTGHCDEFHTEVRKLTGPYLPISDDHYKTLIDKPHDYYLTAGGTVMTFGGATTPDTDYQYALMPLQSEFAQKIIDAQNDSQQTKSKSSGN